MSGSPEELLPRLYAELRSLAGHYLRDERPGHTLSATALVHEAYLRLQDGAAVEIRDRNHFLALCATAMRRVLVDAARARRRDKRGGSERPITLHEEVAVTSGHSFDVLELDEALTKLAALHARHARVVELRFFAQMTFEEMSELLGVSVRTLKDDWRTARLWLLEEIDPQPGP